MRPSRSLHSSASALLIVLGMIALASVVVLAFFSAATTERASVHNQASAEAARNLAGNALQLVMAKIADGTKGGSASAPLAWASQPGMIRTYDTSGNPARYYKLYSSGTLTVDNPAGLSLGALLADDAPPTNWKASPALWSDLNSPVADSTGRLNYPILDPSFQDPDPARRTGTNVSAEGFSISSGTLGYTASQPAAAENNPAPMPVKWLYQLKDGTLVPGTSAGSAASSGNTVTVAAATAANPIVGRIAFWTDDETCKVNINTAAEGTYWDTPRFRPAINWGAAIQGNPPTPNQSVAWQFPDIAFACYQPAQFEFQRYPGHPAQVALSSVFPALSATNAIVNGVANPGAIASLNTIASRLTPKMAWEGTTQAGTVWAGASTVDLSRAERKAPYATLNEYQFSGTTGSQRQPNSLGASSITRNDLEAAKFFCTANGRSPEVNLFNQPRIACWPVDTSLASGSSSYLNRTTAYDRLIAFCSTLRRDLGFVGGNSYRYFFQRADAQSPTNDYKNIQRNQQLYAYLQRLTSSPVPGFGGNFLSKYGSDRDQILTEIFDYIRCTNLVDPGLPGYPIAATATGGKVWPRLNNQFATAIRTPFSDNGSNKLLDLGQAMPIRIGNTVGFGRFAAIKELAIVFVCVGDGANALSNNISTNLALDGVALAPDEIRVQMMLLVAVHEPAAGMVQLNPDLLIRISGLEGVGIANATRIGGTTGSLFTLPANCTNWCDKLSNCWVPQYYVPLGIRPLFSNRRPPCYSTSLTRTLPIYPFVSNAFTVRKAERINFGGANLTLELYQGKNVFDPANPDLAPNYKDAGAPSLSSVLGSSENLHQTARITFPADSSVVLPTLNSGTNRTNNQYLFKIESRLCGDPANDAVTGNDTVRCRYFDGDGRLAAVMTDIPSAAFKPYPGNAQQLDPWIWNCAKYPIGGTGSQTVSSPMIPPGTTATTGDFDITMRVGPGGLINKPDEGDNSRGMSNGAGGGWPPYFFYDQFSTNTLLYTPNRIMPSPGMFGSLPTGAKAGVSWRTLLFRPQPSHPSYAGTTYPMMPDHLMMDLFWMPIVEPYAISETFSTAGKVNMNYQILPFTYINRPTALKAAMKVEMGHAIPNGTSSTINFDSAPGTGDPITGGSTWRKNLNLSESNGSLRQFREKFAAGEIFRSATQICDIYLVPRDQSWTSDSAAQSFWNNHLNTPENLREKPYANLYARLTTKSNTFTVHVRAQALQKAPGSPADQWIEGRDKVVAEERSSSVVERYLDSEDSSLIDFADSNNSDKLLSDFYRMRVLSTKRFAP